MRILSLLPAATEMVHALGFGDQIVGISHECDYPAIAKQAPVATRPRIDPAAGGDEMDRSVRELLGRGEALFELDEPLIRGLQPDVILTQGLCPVCAIDPRQVDKLCAELPSPPRVIRLAPTTLDDVLNDIELLGHELGASATAAALLRELNSRRQSVVARVASLRPRPHLLILEWLDPFFSAGHWNPQLIGLAGAIPVLSTAGQHSRQLSFAQIAAADPDLIVIACCGFSIARSAAEFERLRSLPWESLSAYRNDQIVFADGSQLFNRPGPRLLDTLELLAELARPRAGAKNVSVRRLVKYAQSSA